MLHKIAQVKRQCVGIAEYMTIIKVKIANINSSIVITTVGYARKKGITHVTKKLAPTTLLTIENYVRSSK